MIIITIVAGTVMVFVFTRNSADFMYDIGCNNIASLLYYKSYKDSGEISDCYRALNISIALGDNEKIIEYYETFIADEKYQEFIDTNTRNAERLDVSILERSAIINDNNYLVNSYVKSLKDNNQVDQAKNIALDNFVQNSEFTFKEQGAYALGIFVTNDNLDFFTETHTGFDSALTIEMQEYFDSLVILFDTNKSVTSDVDKAYLVALGNRIIDVGQDLNNIYDLTDTNDDKISDNVTTMLVINNVIKGII